MKDVIVVKVLHFSHWASNKTRLNIDTGFDQLLWPYTVMQVKLSWQKRSHTHSQSWILVEIKSKTFVKM